MSTHSRFISALILSMAAASCPALSAAAPAPVAVLSGTELRDSGLRDSVRARALMGAGVWSRVLRIENRGRTLVYPSTVYALAFETEGILWFYTDSNGTQSLSLRQGCALHDEGNLDPLIHALDPGFGAWAFVAETQVAQVAAKTAPVGPKFEALPNGCWIESVAALNRLVLGGGEAVQPRLLSYYVRTPTGVMGHTVLLFLAGGALEAVDPAGSGRAVQVPIGAAANALATARFLRGAQVAGARTLALENRGHTSRAASLYAGAQPAPRADSPAAGS